MERDSAWALAEGWAGVEALLGGAAGIDALAVATRAIERRRGIKHGSELLRLALRYATAGSLRTTAAWGAAALGVVISDVGLLDRLRQAETGDFLETLVGRLLAQAAQTELGAAWAGPPIRLVDSSVFSGPGRKGTQLRLHASYDPLAQRFVTLKLTPAAQGERLGLAGLEPGMVGVADRNYAKTPQLRDLAERGAFFLVRANLHSLRALDPKTGERLGSDRILAALGQAGSCEIEALLVEARSKKGEKPKPPLKVRLLVLRSSPAQAAHELKRIERSRSKHGSEPRADTVCMAEVTLLATNLEPQAWPITRLSKLYRLRWQIELAFKALKSTFHMRQPPNKDPEFLRTWLLANLASALLAERLAHALKGALPPSEDPA